MTYYVGIDPGVSGAIAIIDSNTTIHVLEDFQNISQYFHQLDLKRSSIGLLFLEQVHIWPGASAQSSTTFMRNAGAIDAVLEILNIKREIDLPHVWQTAIIGLPVKPPTKGLKKAAADKIKRDHRKAIKARSVQHANQYFGLRLSSTEDGKADALNMALYAMKYHKNQF